MIKNITLEDQLCKYNQILEQTWKQKKKYQ